ncbi:MAG: PIN domain-containing protein [Gemmatimonadetes bacterium]|nr:PIN domain-containing protein [Gemmatimonadota bacterium]MYC73756.1 PIN domain-containing protein [Gemmatimonadota bacterium]MYI62035.1 PIN domain-containing protein [Gemmatimonadota bacterium]
MTTADEILFADTNVFLSATDRSRKHHAQAWKLLQAAAEGKAVLAVSGQIIREYLVVATRPVEVNGLGLAAEDALKNIAVFTRPPFLFCEESERVSRHLRDLVQTHRLTGKRVHDGNIVATMLAEGINRLITENEEDFASFKEIEAIGLAPIP